MTSGKKIDLTSFQAFEQLYSYQRWSRGHKDRGQGQGHKKILRPRPRTDLLEAKAKDQGHRRKCSPKKRSSKFFSGNLKKKGLQKFFSSDLYLKKPKKRSLQIFRKVSGVFQQIFNVSKIVLSSSRGQSIFRGFEASRPKPRLRTSKCVLENVLEAKDVLEDFTSESYNFTFAYLIICHASFFPIKYFVFWDSVLRFSPQKSFSGYDFFHTPLASD